MKDKLNTLNKVIQNIMIDFIAENRFVVDKIEIINEKNITGGFQRIISSSEHPPIELNEKDIKAIKTNKFEISEDFLDVFPNETLLDKLIDRTSNKK